MGENFLIEMFQRRGEIFCQSLGVFVSVYFDILTNLTPVATRRKTDDVTK